MDVDFTSPDNLIFFSIIFVLGAVILLVSLLVIVKVAKAIKKLVFRVFNVDAKKPKLNQKNNAGWLIEKGEENKEVVNIPKQRILGGDSAGIIGSNRNGLEEEQIDRAENTFEEKEEKDIAEGLSRLKSSGPASGGTLESKMPSREENQEEESHERVKIPKAKRFFTSNAVTKSEDKNIDAVNKGAHRTQGIAQRVTGFEKTAVTTSHGIIKPMGVVALPDKGGNIMSAQVESSQAEKSSSPREQLPIPQDQDSPFFQKPDFLKNIVGSEKKAKEKNNTISKSADSSIFGGKEEISRIELRQKLRWDPSVAKAQKDLRMNLSPVARAKLEKETFSKLYGLNVSKKDLKINLKRMGREWAGTTDMKRKEVLRKQIKFFKKIGGIK